MSCQPTSNLTIFIDAIRVKSYVIIVNAFVYVYMCMNNYAIARATANIQSFRIFI